MFKHIKGKDVLILLSSLVLFLSIPITVSLTKQKQEIRTRAQSKSISTLTGKLQISHKDNFENNTSTNEYFLKTDDGTLYKLESGQITNQQNGAQIVISGTKEGDIITTATVQSLVPTDLLSSATGIKKIAVILFNFQNNTSEPYTPAQAQGSVFTDPDSTKAYYQKTSFGKLTLEGKSNPNGTNDVYGWYTIPYNDSPCDVNAWISSARSIAEQQGQDLNGYDYYVYATTSPTGCNYNARAGLDNNIWISTNY